MSSSPPVSTIGRTVFEDEPVYCITSDIEWSPEWAISAMIALFDDYDVPFTPFVTHHSALLEQRFRSPGMDRRVGVHPNFMPGSSHGGTTSEIMDCVNKLWPRAISFRSHHFVDSFTITSKFIRRGFRYDSNLCLFLQPRLVPLPHASGLVRFPVFWEDDVHFHRDMPSEIGSIVKYLSSPGLKVINVHPLIVALNVPDSKFYSSHKHLFHEHDADQWRQSVWAGAGTHSLLRDILDHIRQAGYQLVDLHDAYHELVVPSLEFC